MRKVLFILGQLQDEDIEWMISVGSKKAMQAGTVMIEANRPVGYLYFVLSGTFAIKMPGGASIATLQKGEILGEMSFVEASPPVVSVVAVENASVLSIPHDAIRERMDDNPAFAARMYRAIALFLSDRLRKTMGQLGYGKAEEMDSHEPLKEDELDMEVLGHLHLAGERFERILKKMGA